MVNWSSVAVLEAEIFMIEVLIQSFSFQKILTSELQKLISQLPDMLQRWVLPFQKWESKAKTMKKVSGDCCPPLGREK